MWKLLWLFLVSAFSQYIAHDGVGDKIRMMEKIKPMLEIYISDSLEPHKNSLLGLCVKMISDSETKMEQIIKATTPDLRVCNQGWISSPEKCYYVSTTSEKTDWRMAMERCNAMGANLVEIRTDEEAAFILRNMPSHVGYAEYIFTGRKRNDRGAWVFASNDEFVDTSMRSWDRLEPGIVSPTCGCVNQSYHFEMLECVCTGYNLLYICEIVR